MRLICDNRASRILYNFLRSNDFKKPFIVPANVCEVIPSTFEEAGVPVEFADIDRYSLCLNFTPYLSKLDKYSGMLYVHSYGIEDTPIRLFETVKKNSRNFSIIDDKCLCIPDLYLKENVADLTLFSVGGKKQVDLGKGGFAFIREDIAYCKAMLPPDSFMSDEKWVLDEERIINQIEEVTKHKNSLNHIYQENLPNKIQMNERYQGWRYNILTEKKNEILEALFSAGLFASGHYAVQDKDMFREYPNAESLHNKVINLFNDFYYSEFQAMKTCEIINGLI